MLSFLSRINLIRYLIVWRVNQSIAFLPRYLSLDISRVIGSIIAKRLPSSDKTAWKKALDPLASLLEVNSGKEANNASPIPDNAWPIQAVLLVYPGKRTFGRDELIFWELKLFGDSADHGFFLEVILPAMEEASFTSDPRWNQKNRLWGHFDIHSVYASRGDQWEPVVSEGRLNLRYRATPFQWLENLKFSPQYRFPFRKIRWMSPFDLTNVLLQAAKFDISLDGRTLFQNNAPTLTVILSGLIFRLNELLYTRSKKTGKIGDFFADEDRKQFHEILDEVEKIAINKNNIQQAPVSWPGKWIGVQRFATIPRPVIPYLELASILHIGKQTHYGCGTFMIA